MIRHCIAMAVTGLALFGSFGIAHAQTDDERFEEMVSALGITAPPDMDLPAVGQNVCDTLTDGFATNVNPVPVVRGVVTSMQNANMTREQAVGFMQASVAVYCPQHARSVGR